MNIKELTKRVGQINEPRRDAYGYFLHNLVDILVIGLLSFICGGKDFKDMEVFGKCKKTWLSGFLKLANGIPDSDTFRRVFERINPNELSKCLNDWIMCVRDYKSTQTIAIDGKTIRGSGNDSHKAFHVVSAWAAEHSITLGQYTVDEKSNEIIAIPELLKLIDFKGSVVTIDAMGCQQKIAKQVIEGGADYCLSLKKNQKNLHKAVVNLFEKMDNGGETNDMRVDFYEEKTCSGSRIDKREISVISAHLLEEKEREKFENINSLVRIRHTSTDKGATKTDERYFISSLENNARRLAYAIRSHWSIESQLHQYLDVVFEEDKSKAKKDNSPINLNSLRKAALSLLLPLKTKGISMRKMIFRASLENEFLEEIVFG